MPVVDFGEQFNPGGGNRFFKLENKGDKVRFRLLGAPYIEGKHFVYNDDGKKTVVPCPRINDDSECEYCREYFSTIAKAKKENDGKVPKEVSDDLNDRGLRVAISVYYPIINRDTEEFQVFETRISVRTKIEQKVEIGVRVLESDFVVMRTEDPGSNYYSLDKVDSADTQPLTDKELQEVERFKKTNITELVNGGYDEDSGVAQEENTEVVDDIAF